MKLEIEKSVQKHSGIYKIVNIKNNRFYIGSAIRLITRFYQHRNRLQKNIHDNDFLQRDYNKNCKDDFQFQLIESFQNIDRKKLFEIEQNYLFNCYDGAKQCYNLTNLVSSYKLKQTKAYFFNDDDIEYIKQNYGQISARLIAKKLSCSLNKIYGFCYRNNIESENVGNYRSKSITNNFAFSEINKKSAFWSGFILASASVYENNLFKIDLIKNKKDKIIALSNYLGYKDKLFYYKCKSVSDEQIRMSFYDEQLCSDLRKNFNIKPNKIDNFKMPTLDNYQLDFLKGFYWEKGTYCKDKTYGNVLSFTSSNKELISFIKSALQLSQKIWSHNKRNEYRLTIKGKKAKIIHKLLSDNEEYFI